MVKMSSVSIDDARSEWVEAWRDGSSAGDVRQLAVVYRNVWRALTRICDSLNRKGYERRIKKRMKGKLTSREKAREWIGCNRLVSQAKAEKYTNEAYC